SAITHSADFRMLPSIWAVRAVNISATARTVQMLARWAAKPRTKAKTQATAKVIGDPRFERTSASARIRDGNLALCRMQAGKPHDAIRSQMPRLSRFARDDWDSKRTAPGSRQFWLAGRSVQVNKLLNRILKSA